MGPELLNFLVKVIFVSILIVLLLWLISGLLSVFKQGKKGSQKDDIDSSGYETITQIRRKERSVIALSWLIISICILLFGGLSYWTITSADIDNVEAENLFNLAVVFIPPIIFLVLVVKASLSYMRKQQKTLEDFRHFQSQRRKSLAEYEQKRHGKKDSKE